MLRVCEAVEALAGKGGFSPARGAGSAGPVSRGLRPFTVQSSPWQGGNPPFSEQVLLVSLGPVWYVCLSMLITVPLLEC